jgi:Na+/proline symporter
MNSALVIIALTAILALALGLAARRGKRMTLEQWTVGGRGFGAPLVFLLTAGEIYTTFTFLGGSGYAYGKGAPGLLHPGLRNAGLYSLLLAAAADLALRAAGAAGVAVAFLHPQIR